MTKSDNAIKVVFADGDDWQGLYIDGVLRIENHRLDVVDLLHVVKLYVKGPFDVECKEVCCDWIEDRGSFPRNISEVQFL